MIRRKTITERQARLAMEAGEFTADVVASSPLVAIVLTQGWCYDWKRMERWLDSPGGDAATAGYSGYPDVDVYVLIYDEVDYFDEFRAFKEKQFANRSVPYVRYYSDSRYIGDSNQVTRDEFFGRFSDAPSSDF